MTATTAAASVSPTADSGGHRDGREKIEPRFPAREASNNLKTKRESAGITPHSQMIRASAVVLGEMRQQSGDEREKRDREDDGLKPASRLHPSHLVRVPRSL